MRWEDIRDEFGLDIPIDQPILPLNVVCEMLDMQYHILHEIMKEGIIERSKKYKNKKLLSVKEVKRLKYIKYLIDERGVNLKGVKVIIEMETEE